MPRVSVIMSVYNGERFLAEAVKSILNQTFHDFEFIVINDGSTDYSLNIIQQYTDARIRLINNDRNIGLTKSLNKGIALAKGEFIARMDCDDISTPNRFQKQVEFLERHPEIGICGSWVKLFGKKNNVVKHPLLHEEIKFTMLSHNAFTHPSVMWRRELFEAYILRYNENFETAQDYELFARAVYEVKTANIPEFLLLYREHGGQVTEMKKHDQRRNAEKIKLMQIKKLKPCLSEQERKAHLCLFDCQFSKYRDNQFVKVADEWMYALYNANKKAGIYAQPLILDFWRQKLFGSGFYHYDLKKWRLVQTSRCARHCNISSIQKIKLFGKCLIGWRVKEVFEQ